MENTEPNFQDVDERIDYEAEIRTEKFMRDHFTEEVSADERRPKRWPRYHDGLQRVIAWRGARARNWGCFYETGVEQRDSVASFFTFYAWHKGKKVRAYAVNLSTRFDRDLMNRMIHDVCPYHTRSYHDAPWLLPKTGPGGFSIYTDRKRAEKHFRRILKDQMKPRLYDDRYAEVDEGQRRADWVDACRKGILD